MKVSGKIPLILVGGGGHCRSVMEALHDSCWQPAGIIDKDPSLHSVKGIPVLGNDKDLEKFKSEFAYAVVTVGQTKYFAPRARLFHRLKNAGYILPVIAASSAHVSQDAIVGEGSVILHYTILNADAHIGANCIINNCALVEHDVTIGDNCHISTGAIVNGGARIGDNVFIGSGSVIREGVSIGDNSIIGMGSMVRKSVPGNMIFWNKQNGSECRPNPYIDAEKNRT